MKILIISSCTGKKAFSMPNALSINDFKSGSEKLHSKEEELRRYMLPAELMYTGQQHVRLMEGINYFGAQNIDLYVISAGYGLINSKKEIAPYNTTFTGMRKSCLNKWSQELNIPKDFSKLLLARYDLALILLGEKYLEACLLSPHMLLHSPTFLFCGQKVKQKFSDYENLKLLSINRLDCKRFSCPQIGLKGEVAKIFLKKLKDDKNFLSRIQNFKNYDEIKNFI
jgi:hypothetical protein